jgi:hypothetical protein
MRKQLITTTWIPAFFPESFEKGHHPAGLLTFLFPEAFPCFKHSGRVFSGKQCRITAAGTVQESRFMVTCFPLRPEA